MIDMCPKCAGQTFDSNGEPCHLCLGRGVVYPVFETCSRCNGKGCKHCADGYVAMPYPFVFPSKRYDREDIDEALIQIRTGFHPDVDEDTHYDTLGLLGSLIILSEERTEESTDTGEWLEGILQDADALVIDASGIYLEHAEQGIRIHRFSVR